MAPINFTRKRKANTSGENFESVRDEIIAYVEKNPEIYRETGTGKILLINGRIYPTKLTKVRGFCPKRGNKLSSNIMHLKNGSFSFN